jgi:plasmid stabilization system protein ParE
MAEIARITWSPEAVDHFHNFYSYVKRQWSEEIAERFIDLILQFEDMIMQYPHSCRMLKDDPNIRSGFIHKHVRAHYRIRGEEIEIIALLDNRSAMSMGL